MFWQIYYQVMTFLRPLARLGLRLFSGLTSAKRARVLILRGGQVLLVQDIFSRGSWSVPGGGVNRGEDPVQAASREIREELGFEIDPSELKLIGDIARDTSTDQTYEARIYLYQVDEGVEIEVSRNKWEIIEWGWHSMEDLPMGRGSVVDRRISLFKSN